jgi:hypothetical protein
VIPKSRLSGGCGYIWRLSKCARTQEEWDRAKKCKTFRHHVSAIVLKAGDTSITNRLRWVIKQLALRPGFSLISSLAEPSGGLSVVFGDSLSIIASRFSFDPPCAIRFNGSGRGLL